MGDSLDPQIHTHSPEYDWLGDFFRCDFCGQEWWSREYWTAVTETADRERARENEKLSALNEELWQRVVSLADAVSFFRSVIQCREPWSATCQQVYDDVSRP